MKRNEFIMYCWTFYGPEGIYGDFFNHSLRKSTLAKAVDLRMKSDQYEGDTFDREAVRDILLLTANRKKSEGK